MAVDRPLNNGPATDVDCVRINYRSQDEGPFVSWLVDGAASREDLLALHPDLAADHDRVLAAVWAGSVQPQILELCRLRMATLLGNTVAWTEPRSPAAVEAGLDQTLIDSLSTWATNPAFDAATRACIGLAEQYVIDVHGVTDEQVANVETQIGSDGVITLTTALAVWELTHRFDNALLNRETSQGAS